MDLREFVDTIFDMSQDCGPKIQTFDVLKEYILAFQKQKGCMTGRGPTAHGKFSLCVQ